MGHFRGIISLSFTLYLALFLKTLATDEPIYFGCSNVQGDLPYQTSIGQVLANLYDQARAYGYGAWSIGGVNGGVQCRGDVVTIDCLNCFMQVRNTLQTRCFGSLEAIVYDDYCQLLYTDDSRWPGYDSQVYYCSAGDKKLGNEEWFYEFMNWLYYSLDLEAITKPNYMSYGSVTLGPRTVYAYAQCYNFLTMNECYRCLERMRQATDDSCVRTYFGGRLVGGSCTIRYELYPFLKV